MFNLPRDLQMKIWEFDPTFRNRFYIVLQEMIAISALHHTIMEDAGNLFIFQSYCKSFLRYVKKRQLRCLAKVTGTRLPRRFTKRRALLAIIYRKIMRSTGF
jgi:hypothetical protein